MEALRTNLFKGATGTMFIVEKADEKLVEERPDTWSIIFADSKNLDSKKRVHEFLYLRWVFRRHEGFSLT